MKNLRFTQIFQESKEPEDLEEKIKKIKELNPDAADEIDKELEDAKAQEKFEDVAKEIIEKYKDSLEEKASDEKEDTKDDNEEVVDEKTIEREDNQARNKAARAQKNGESGISPMDSKSRDIIRSKLGIDLSQSPYKEFDEYFPYDLTTEKQKDKIKVLFDTSKMNIGLKPGDEVSSGSEYYHLVSWMNEEAIYLIAKTVYENIFDKYIEKLNNVRGKGAESNKYITLHSNEFHNEVLEILKGIDDTTVNVASLTGEEGMQQVSGKILKYVFMRILPATIQNFKNPQMGSGAHCGILNPNKADSLFYKYVYYGTVENIDNDAFLTDVIYDAYLCFLGGRAAYHGSTALHSKWDNVNNNGSNGILIYDAGNQGTDSIFEYSATSIIPQFEKTFFSIMEGEKSSPDVIKLLSKTGKRKLGKGFQSKAIELAQGNTTVNDLELSSSLDSGIDTDSIISDKDKFLALAATVTKTNVNPFSEYASQFRRITQSVFSMTARQGVKKLGVSNYQKNSAIQFTPEEELEKLSGPALEKALKDNEAMKQLYTAMKKGLKASSLNDQLHGKDGDSATTVQDQVADTRSADNAPEGYDESFVIDELEKGKSVLKQRLDAMYAACSSIKEKEISAVGYYDLMCMARFIWSMINAPHYTVMQSLSFISGKTVKADNKSPNKSVFGKVGTLKNLDDDREKFSVLSKVGSNDAKIEAFGLGDTLFKKAMFALKSKEATYAFNNSPRGLAIADSITDYVSNLYSKCLTKLYDSFGTSSKETVESSLDKLAPSKVWVGGESSIMGSVSELPINRKSKTALFNLSTKQPEVSGQNGVTKQWNQANVLSRISKMDMETMSDNQKAVLKDRYGIDIDAYLNSKNGDLIGADGKGVKILTSGYATNPEHDTFADTIYNAKGANDTEHIGDNLYQVKGTKKDNRVVLATDNAKDKNWTISESKKVINEFEQLFESIFDESN